MILHVGGGRSLNSNGYLWASGMQDYTHTAHAHFSLVVLLHIVLILKWQKEWRGYGTTDEIEQEPL